MGNGSITSARVSFIINFYEPLPPPPPRTPLAMRSPQNGKNLGNCGKRRKLRKARPAAIKQARDALSADHTTTNLENVSTPSPNDGLTGDICPQINERKRRKYERRDNKTERGNEAGLKAGWEFSIGRKDARREEETRRMGGGKS